jgi:hypothetical protein
VVLKNIMQATPGKVFGDQERDAGVERPTTIEKYDLHMRIGKIGSPTPY